jgi:carbon monoxide dehydrogenase subunit G
VIETEQSISIGSGIEAVWDYVKDIRNWAGLMPGSQSCTVLNRDDSRWTLKVGAGGLVKTVVVLVHVEQWNAPAEVIFSYALQGDPVVGRGSYTAARISAHETEITLKLRVEGSGPMSRLWEAMSTPLLPQLAKSFSGRLKAEIESAARAALPPATSSDRKAMLGGLGRWILTRWRAIIRSGLQQ